MENKTLNPRFVFIVTVIIAGALFRLIPHWPNFTPITAMALFGGAYLQKRYQAFLVPLAALFLSDMILGFHSNMLAVYFSFILIAGTGMLLRGNIKAVTVAGATVGSSLLFFFITNFAVWIGSPYYPQTLTGLTESYIAGLPFLQNAILGDLFYTTLFFGVFYLAKQRFPVLEKVQA